MGCDRLLKSNKTAESVSRVNFLLYVLKNLTHANPHNKTYSKGYGETDMVAGFSKVPVAINGSTESMAAADNLEG